MEFDNWLLFSSIALIATITPGPAVLLVVTHSVGYGVGRTVCTILGNISGLFVLSLLSVLGLSALVLYSALAFTCIKLTGAVYLIYLGIKLWRNGFSAGNPGSLPGNRQADSSGLKMYFQGVTVALSNPKAIAFTTALFPQFIDRTLPLLPQFTLLVVTFMTYSFLCLFAYSMFSSRTGAGLRNERFEKMFSRIFGSVFIGSGLLLGTTS